jgi:hypothetical protein
MYENMAMLALLCYCELEKVEDERLQCMFQ